MEIKTMANNELLNKIEALNEWEALLEEAKAEADKILDGFEEDLQKKEAAIERLTSDLEKKELEILQIS